MKIEAVRVTGFRNIRDQILDFKGYERVVFYGDNGQGKTNFLEALFYLLRLESFRAAPRRILVMAGQKYSALQGKVEREGITFRLSVRVDAGGTAAMIDRARVSRFSDFRSRFPAVYFCPQALGLIEGSPAERRKFFDRLFSSADGGYAEALARYRRLLLQRRAALAHRNPALLKALYERFRAESEALWRARDTCWNEFHALWQDPFEKALHVRWIPAHFTREARTLEKTFCDGSILLEGPHRDRWQFVSAHQDLRLFGSRGEQRMALIALKQAETRYIEVRSGTPAVHIFDDPLAELDENAHAVVRSLWTGRQCFIATTNPTLFADSPKTLWLKVTRGAAAETRPATTPGPP
jgi:DNA replication and repair protein RecF